MPIVRSTGAFFGTLCAIDPRPHLLNTPGTVGMFKLFANLIAFHLDAVERLVSSEATLGGEREQGGLREQFIAVLGHDLRNPLANIIGGLHLLQRRGLDDEAAEIVRLMQGSTARMSALIDNVVDFARGRLGGGFSLQRRRVALEPVLRQVIAELQSTAPGRAIEATFALDQPVDCDPVRIAQLFSNLLGQCPDARLGRRAGPRRCPDGGGTLHPVGGQCGRAHSAGRAVRRSSSPFSAPLPAPASRALASGSTSPPKSPTPTAPTSRSAPIRPRRGSRSTFRSHDRALKGMKGQDVARHSFSQNLTSP